MPPPLLRALVAVLLLRPCATKPPTTTSKAITCAEELADARARLRDICTGVAEFTSLRWTHTEVGAALGALVDRVCDGYHPGSLSGGGAATVTSDAPPLASADPARPRTEVQAFDAAKKAAAAIAAALDGAPVLAGLSGANEHRTALEPPSGEYYFSHSVAVGGAFVTTVGSQRQTCAIVPRHAG